MKITIPFIYSDQMGVSPPKLNVKIMSRVLCLFFTTSAHLTSLSHEKKFGGFWGVIFIFKFEACLHRYICVLYPVEQPEP